MKNMETFDDSDKISKQLKFYSTDIDFLEDLIRSVNQGVRRTEFHFGGETSVSRLVHSFKAMECGLIPYVIDEHLCPLVLRISNPHRMATDYEVFHVNSPSHFGKAYFKQTTRDDKKEELLDALASEIIKEFQGDSLRSWDSDSSKFNLNLDLRGIDDSKDFTKKEVESFKVQNLLYLTRESVFNTNNEGGVFRKLTFPDGRVLAQFFPIKENLYPSIYQGSSWAFYSTAGGEEITNLPFTRLNSETQMEVLSSMDRDMEILIVNQMISDAKYCANVMPHNEIKMI